MTTSAQSCNSVCEQIVQVRDAFPRSIALKYGDLLLTYEELVGRADRFAAHLAALGVLPGQTVALCMERSLDWIIAALGILRIGAAYVPLDLAWPDSRLRFAVEDSGAVALVARSLLLEHLRVEVHGVDPSRDAEAIAAAPRFEPPPTLPHALAYVIYTSGSTGVPKGVEITHANLSHLIQWHQKAFAVTRHDRASHLAGLGFDASVWEIWPNLAAGAALCLADDSVRSSPELIREWMLSERVTIGFVPTVHAGALIHMNWPDATALRFLLTGGDRLQRSPVPHLPFAVVNNYGPTEGTVVATSSVLKPGAAGAPPIGRAIAGARVYLLDEHGEQVADGEAGEIYVGGSGIARGYRNLPEQTERNFVADPFAGVPRARMYRTGDRGVRRPDGEIEFHGRLDRQTKIRGQRVELDEIGNVLCQSPAVEFAVATVLAEGGENQIIAYVLPRKGAPVPTAQDLQEHLLHSLPQYMIPATFVHLDSLPLSPNGKLDLNLLPKLSEATLLARRAGNATSNPIEGKLLGVVRDLLKSDAVTAEDNFFLAGGHSLLGMQLIMRVRSAFGVDLTLRQMFETPTVKGLAVSIEAKLVEERLTAIWKDLLKLNSIPPDGNFFELGGKKDLVELQRRIIAEFGQGVTTSELLQNVTIAQQGQLIHGTTRVKPAFPSGVMAMQPNGQRNSIFWLQSPGVTLAKALGDDRPFLYVGLTDQDINSIGKEPPMQDIATCLMGKILATQAEGPYMLGGFCVGGILSYEVASQLRASGREVSLLILLDTPSPYYYKTPHALGAKVTQPRYLMKRIARLGVKMSFVHLQQRIAKYLPEKSGVVKPEWEMAHELIERAAALYQPEIYPGKVVLLLASEHPPHVNFLPEWQSLVPQNLEMQYVRAYHPELTEPRAAQFVADAITPHLGSGEEQLVSTMPIEDTAALTK